MWDRRVKKVEKEEFKCIKGYFMRRVGEGWGGGEDGWGK